MRNVSSNHPSLDVLRELLSILSKAFGEAEPLNYTFADPQKFLKLHLNTTAKLFTFLVNFINYLSGLAVNSARKCE